jgi:hypothetical protein
VAHSSWSLALRFLFVGTVVLQSLIVLLCVAFGHANAEVGFLQYRLPEFLFWVYVWVGVGAPGIALTTLIVIWMKRAALRSGTSKADRNALRQLIALCVLNVCAIAVWFCFGGLVFLGAGGNR